MKSFNFIAIILSLFFANVSYGEATYCLYIESHFFEDSVDKPDFKENTDFISVNENPISFNNEPFDSRLMDGLAKGCFSEKILKDGLNEFNFGIQSRIVINFVHQRFKVYMEGPSRGRFDLFNITAKGTREDKASYSGSTTLQLSFASLNPELDYAQRGLITDVDINRAKIDITNRDIESARKILSELLNKKFEDIVPEDFTRFDKNMLVQLLSDLRKDKAQLNADIEAKIQKIRQDVLDLSNYAQSELEKSSGSEGDINRALDTIDLPDLELPALDDEIPPFDEAKSQYAQYATEILQKLDAAKASNNRQYFLELVWVWAREQASLDLLLSARPGVLPAEYASFMAAQKRVYDYVYTVVDHRFYFLDVPIPEDLKDGIEQEMNEFSPQLAKSLKATLNESGSRLNSEDSATIIEMFRAIRLFYRIAREEEDQKVKKALVQEADERTQELISILRMGLSFTPADPIFGFCEMITGKEGCLARGRDLSEVEMVIACAPFFLKGLGKVVAMGSKRFGGYFKVERVAEKGDKLFDSAKRIGITTSTELKVFGQTLKKYKIDFSKFPDGIGFRSDLKQHLSIFDGFTQKVGIKGAHNSEAFAKAITDNGARISKTTEHASIPGIKVVEYEVPKLDAALRPTGEFKTGFKKTIYDPNIISDTEILQLGQIAAATGYEKAISEGSRSFVEKIGGIDFQVFLENDAVSNVFPIIEGIL